MTEAKASFVHFNNMDVKIESWGEEKSTLTILTLENEGYPFDVEATENKVVLKINGNSEAYSLAKSLIFAGENLLKIRENG